MVAKKKPINWGATARKNAAAASSKINGHKKPAKPKPTQASIIAEVNVLLDKAQEALNRSGLREVPWTSYGYTRSMNPLSPFREKLNTLQTALNELLRTEYDAKRRLGQDPEWPDSGGVIELETRRPDGIVPELVRPGRFLIWVDRVPVRVEWKGMLGREITIHAVDWKLPWINETGFKSSFPFAIDPQLDAAEIVRNMIRAGTTDPAFKLVWMTSKVTEPEPWVQAAVKAGPYLPIRLSPKASAFQTKLF